MAIIFDFEKLNKTVALLLCWFTFFLFFQTSKGKESTALCYYNKAGPAGWCGTCYDGDLQPGEEGYCDYYNGKWISLV